MSLALDYRCLPVPSNQKHKPRSRDNVNVAGGILHGVELPLVVEAVGDPAAGPVLGDDEPSQQVVMTGPPKKRPMLWVEPFHVKSLS
jgi:hypothetical protein